MIPCPICGLRCDVDDVPHLTDPSAWPWGPPDYHWWVRLLTPSEAV